MVEPVHMQNAVVRVGEVAKIQNVREHVPELQGAAFSQELKRQTERTTEEVTSSPKKEHLKQREGKNSHQEGGKSSTSKGTRSTKKDAGRVPSGDDRGQILDIKV